MAKNMRKLSLMVLTLCVICMGVLLMGITVTDAATQSLSTRKKTIEATKNFTLTVKNLSKTDKVTYSSENKQIAKVSKKGVVTGVSAGTVKIKVKVTDKKKNTKSYICNVTVKELYVPVLSDLKLTQDGDLVLNENNNGIVFEFTSDKNAQAVVGVYDSSDEVVYTKKIATKKNKVNKITWKGQDKDGKNVAGDSYYFMVTSDTASVKSDYFTVYENNDFASGNGSTTNPYAISTVDELKKMALHNGRCFYLTNDLDLGYAELQGMFSKDIPFNGSLDGKGHSIRNVMNTTCMFHAVGETGSIKNLTIDGLVLNVSNNDAMLVNYNYGTIEDVSLLNVSTGGEYGKAGICWENHGTIKKCTVTGSMTASITSSGSRTGDLGGIAKVNTSTGKILNCSVNVNMKYSCPDSWEHRAGMIAATNSGLISDTIVSGSFDAPNWKNYWCTAGTLVGVNDGTIRNCVSIGTTNCDDIGSNKGTVN